MSLPIPHPSSTPRSTKYEEIQENLPTVMSFTELDKCPKFTALLQQLCEKIDKHGISKSMQKKMDLAELSLQKSREIWLLNKLIYHEAGELLADLEVRGQSKNLSIDEQQLRDVFAKALSFSELEDHLSFHINPVSTSTLFGLKKEDIDRHHPFQQHMSTLQQTVMPMIEERLKKKCEQLYQFYVVSEDEGSTSDKLLLAKAHSFPGVIEKRQKELMFGKVALQKVKQQREKQLWLYYEKLLESLSLMETMIQNYMLSSQASLDEINVKCLRTRCEALFLKVRVTQFQIKCNLYTADTVQALKKIKTHLDTSIKQTDRDLQATSRSLDGYHAIGEGFKSLVAEFTQLQQEINNKRWGLEKFAGTNESTMERQSVDIGATGGRPKTYDSSQYKSKSVKSQRKDSSKSNTARKVSFENP